MKHRIDILPGGELSDVVEHALGTTHHQIVKNIRQAKAGEWEAVPGYVVIAEPDGATNILCAVEVDDDQSGDRFILYQDTQKLMRIDYDAEDEYSESTPAELTLPSGVTIPEDVTCKMFVHRGVVRITGPNDGTKGCPLWYGYIDRTIFPDAWREVYLGCFETDTESWTDNNCQTFKYDCDADADGSGMWGAPEKQHALKVHQVGLHGYARQSFTVGLGKTIRVLLMSYKKAGGSGNVYVHLGSTEVGDDYELLDTAVTDEWVMLESAEFVTTGTTLYVSLQPGSGQDDNAYFDFIYIEEKSPIVIQGWKLEKAKLDPLTITIDEAFYYGDDAPANRSTVDMLFKSFTEYDESQFSLLSGSDVAYTPDGTKVKKYLSFNYELGGFIDIVNAIGVKLRIVGTNLATSLSSRISGLGVAFSKIIPGANNFNRDETSYPFYVEEMLGLTEKMVLRYTCDWYAWTDGAYKGIYIWLDYEGGTHERTSCKNDHFLVKGARVTITTPLGTLDTIITRTGAYGQGWFEVAHDASFLFNTGGQGVVWDNMAAFDLERKWVYSPATGYSTVIGVGVLNSANEFYDFADIPAGTSENSPDYDQHVVVGERAFVISNENEEEDIIRYSPIDQPDNLPNLNIEPIASGDKDRALWIGNRDARLVVLKGKSLSQIHMSGDSFYSDIKLATNGLYTGFRGALVHDSTLYFMDQSDLFAFDGNRYIPLMQSEKLRKRYRENVDTDSQLAWDKLNNELHVYLGNSGVMLCWRPEMNEWYERTSIFGVQTGEGEVVTGYERVLGGFLDADNRLIGWVADCFLTQNHSEATAGEAMAFEIKTLLVDGANPERYKQISKVIIQGASSEGVTIEISDPNETRLYSEDVTFPASTVGIVEVYPDYLFREASIIVKTADAAADLTGKIKRISVEVESWQ